MEAEYLIEQHSILCKHKLPQNSTDTPAIAAIGSIPAISPVISKNPGGEGPLMNKEHHL